MANPTTLGGFKILRPAYLASLNIREGGAEIPRLLCQGLAENRVNIVFLAVDFDDMGIGVSLAVQDDQGKEAQSLLSMTPGITASGLLKASIISLFPHRTRPEITGTLLEILSRRGIAPNALAQSASAVSAVLQEEKTQQATEALFEPFSFGPYRTPEDWSLAQKGKERLYKEVVASYQEKRPKVYGLDWQRDQMLLRMDAGAQGLEVLSKAFSDLSLAGTSLTFFVSTPSCRQGLLHFAFTVPKNADFQRLQPRLEGIGIRRHTCPVAVFVMNGPHFGDRYGIAGALLDSLKDAGISLLALSCSVASLSGVVKEEDCTAATEALSSVFDIPSITGAKI
jgi:aspartokinase